MIQELIKNLIHANIPMIVLIIMLFLIALNFIFNAFIFVFTNIKKWRRHGN